MLWWSHCSGGATRGERREERANEEGRERRGEGGGASSRGNLFQLCKMCIIALASCHATAWRRVWAGCRTVGTLNFELSVAEPVFIL